MCTCSPAFKRLALQSIFLFISIFMTASKERNQLISKLDRNYCPFIETLSFGSDIDIKCNETHLIFNEENTDISSWKFANQSPVCRQNGTQQARLNQCDVTRINSNYLKVPMVSSKHYEKACVYCRINYKPIAPLITVTQSEGDEFTLHTFNITATGLAPNESFEILWAKRVSEEVRHSANYWFLQKCMDSIVNIREDTGRMIIFDVDDIPLDRVEFIIRRCHGICRSYVHCTEEQFNRESDTNRFQSPDAIEKISCDYECISGFIPTLQTTTTTTTATTRTTHVRSTVLSTTSKPPNPSHKIELFVFFCILGVVLVIAIVTLISCMLCKLKGRKHIYAKTSHIDPDDRK